MTSGHCGACGRQYSECVCQTQLPRCKHGRSATAAHACADPLCPAHGVQPRCPMCGNAACTCGSGPKTLIAVPRERLERLERVAEAAREWCRASDPEEAALAQRETWNALAALNAPEGSAP